MPHRHHLSWVWLLMLAVAAWLVPALPQPAAYHVFADQRSLAGLPHAADVLSNLAFMVVGMAGWRRAQRLGLGLRLFYAGIVLTALGSAWYHSAPDSDRLVWDRLPMVLAFSGLMATWVGQRVQAAWASPAFLASFLFGGISLAVSQQADNVTPYALFQFGAMLGMLAGLLLFPNPQDPLRWWRLFAWYALAKLCEQFDTQIWELSHGLIAGHALKHLLAAWACWQLLPASIHVKHTPEHA